MKIKNYGWIPDLPDHRDRKYNSVMPLASLPALIDLRSHCPPIWDQGELGSCVSHGVGFAYMFAEMKEGIKTPSVPSRLFIYYNGRVLEHTVNSDSGLQIRDGIKAVAQWGDCPETSWPYDVTKFKSKPGKSVYKTAYKTHAIQYSSVDRSLPQIKSVLANGFPIVIGISVYESFESDEVAKTGIVPMPTANEQLIGGHCVCLVGFNDSTQRFIARNSWGPEWADHGYFYLPYNYIMNSDLSDDFWEITFVPKT